MHSLAYILSKFDVRMTFMAPENLGMPSRIINHLHEHQKTFSMVEPGEFYKIEDADFWYVVRFQKERHEDAGDKYDMRIDRVLVQKHLKDSGKIYHPLPRTGEIPAWPNPNTIDKLPCAGYFDQVKNGVPVSMALYEILAHTGIGPVHHILFE